MAQTTNYTHAYSTTIFATTATTTVCKVRAIFFSSSSPSHNKIHMTLFAPQKPLFNHTQNVQQTKNLFLDFMERKNTMYVRVRVCNDVWCGYVYTFA